jgi:hypothetical protein
VGPAYLVAIADMLSIYEVAQILSFNSANAIIDENYALIVLNLLIQLATENSLMCVRMKEYDGPLLVV